MNRKLMYLLAGVLALSLVGLQVASAVTLDLRIAAGPDDAEEHLATGVMDIDSTDLEFPYEDNANPSATDPQLNVLRFSVALPKGAVVTNAYIELEQDETKGNDKPVNVIIEGQLVPDAPAVVDVAKNLSDRGPWTVAKVKWTVPMGMANNDKFQSPDISSIVSEIVGQAGWASGNALLLAIRDDPDNPSTGLRCVEAFEGEATAAALLHLEAADPAPAAPVWPPSPGDGKVLFEYWDGITGTAISALTGNANYPGNPSVSEWRDEFKSKWARADNYGLRARAYLRPAQTGEYTFYIASDDYSQLFLSTDNTAANAKKIAEVVGYSSSGQYTKLPAQTSAKIALELGKEYYIEALLKEGTGGDGLDVAWSGPGIGDAPVIIAGQYLTALIRDPEPLFMASAPKPADKAVDVTQPLFEWTPGMFAVLHDIYFGTNPTPGAAEYKGPMPMAMYFHVEPLQPGKTYYWRIDEIEATGMIRTGKVWSFTVMPLEAHFQSPADGAQNIGAKTQLKWTAGQNAVSHTIYFGSDKALVTAGDASVKLADQAALTYDLTDLDGFTTYYWRVDEVNAAGTVVAGPVWSFSTVSYLPIADDVITLPYDNGAEPFVTATVLDKPGDWTANGVSDLFVRFQGLPAMVGGFTVDEPNGIYQVSGAGTDIWGNADQFQYVYKTLNGDATMVARVVSNGTGTNRWAKGGVMIRQSLEAGSTHAFMPITGGDGNGYSFQRRLVANLVSTGDNGVAPPVAPPYWVKIERVGDVFTGSISADGETWAQVGTPQTIAMANPVYIGLAVTSHAAGQVRTFTFDDVNMVGDIAGDFETEQIGIAYNEPQPIFAAVEDTNGMLGVVSYSDPAATMITSWWSWKIPLDEFAVQGVDLANVASVYLGVGDLLTPAADGKGVVKFDDVRVVPPVVILGRGDVTGPMDNVKGVPNDGVNAGGNISGWPAAENPATVVDDKATTKFLHFKGEAEPTGVQIELMAGSTLVTGLTFTTANDAAERDPVTFELYGSNESLDGPYELIASGDIVDFAGETAWVRRTKTTTPIRFANETMYKFYQVMFPTVRNPATANSMQIAEIELLSGLGANIVWVTDAWDDDADGVTDDKGWVDLLTANLHAVDYKLDRTWRALDAADIAAMNAADLVIVSRNFNSGDYNNGNERDQWNGVTAPLIMMSMHGVRSSHWKWFNTTTIPNAAPAMKPVDPAHPLFAGVTLDENGQIPAVVTTANWNTSFPGTPNAGNGTVLATRADTGDVWIAMWDAGVEFYVGAGQMAAGPRMYFAAGAQEVPASGVGRGEKNTTPEGDQVFLNAVDMMAR